MGLFECASEERNDWWWLPKLRISKAEAARRTEAQANDDITIVRNQVGEAVYAHEAPLGLRCSDGHRLASLTREDVTAILDAVEIPDKRELVQGTVVIPE